VDTKASKNDVRQVDGAALLEKALACLYGSDAEYDAKKGVELLRKAADIPEPRALYELAFLYRCGGYVERDYQQSVKLCTRAAELGCTTAALVLIDDHRHGALGLPKNHKLSKALATRFFKKQHTVLQPKLRK
jgi:TPR repeat protein